MHSIALSTNSGIVNSKEIIPIGCVRPFNTSNSYPSTSILQRNQVYRVDQMRASRVITSTSILLFQLACLNLSFLNLKAIHSSDIEVRVDAVLINKFDFDGRAPRALSSIIILVSLNFLLR